MSGQTAEVRLEFHGLGVKSGEPNPFPIFVVNGAAERDGWLSLFAPVWALTAPSRRPGPRPGRLWAGSQPTSPPMLACSLPLPRAHPRRHRDDYARTKSCPAADAVTRLDTEAEKWIATARFKITVSGGVLPSVAMFVPGAAWPSGRGSCWMTPTASRRQLQFREASRSTPVVRSTRNACRCRGCACPRRFDGTFWVLRFARPLEQTVANRNHRGRRLW